MKSAGAGLPAAPSNTEELLVRLCSSAEAAAAAWEPEREMHCKSATNADFNSPLDQTKICAAVACGTRLWRLLRRRGVSRFPPDAPQRQHRLIFRNRREIPHHIPHHKIVDVHERLRATLNDHLMMEIGLEHFASCAIERFR